MGKWVTVWKTEIPQTDREDPVKAKLVNEIMACAELELAQYGIPRRTEVGDTFWKKQPPKKPVKK